MKKRIAIVLLALTLSSFVGHKFYVSIFQLNYAPAKKMLQITSRIFVDDLDDALGRKYHRKFSLGEKGQSPEDIAQLKKYIGENLKIKINGKPASMEYLSSEIENNVFVSYFRVNGVTSVKTLDVSCTILFDFVTQQQNIIQTHVGGVKKNMLLTVDNPSDTIKF